MFLYPKDRNVEYKVLIEEDYIICFESIFISKIPDNNKETNFGYLISS